jgi:hypothetical protein
MRHHERGSAAERQLPALHTSASEMGQERPYALQKRSQEVGPREDATRSHAPQAAVAYGPYSGSEE